MNGLSRKDEEFGCQLAGAYRDFCDFKPILTLSNTFVGEALKVKPPDPLVFRAAMHTHSHLEHRSFTPPVPCREQKEEMALHALHWTLHIIRTTLNLLENCLLIQF